MVAGTKMERGRSEVRFGMIVMTNYMKSKGTGKMKNVAGFWLE